MKTVIWLAIGSGVLQLACATRDGGLRLRPLPKDEQRQEFSLRAVPAEGRREQTQFYSATLTKTFEDGQIVHAKEEIVEFTVQVDGEGVDKATGGIKQVVRVIEKNGFVDLHELAFPEVGEDLPMAFTANGRVLQAGAYPRDSIFYVPPVSLPDRPVKIGDTWTMSEQWASSANGMPMRIELLTILKAVYICSQEQRCADLEISGTVTLPARVAGLTFASEIRGRMLFGMAKGTVIWGLIRNAEKLSTEADEIQVRS